MTMEKRNVVNDKRTPEPELSRPDADWDKKAADLMDPPAEAEAIKDSKPGDK